MHSQEANPVSFAMGVAVRPAPGRAVSQDSASGPEAVPGRTLVEKGYLYVVADGIGGEAAGDVASRMAVETIFHAYYQDPDPDLAIALRRAVQAANAKIHRRGQNPDAAGMGTTVVAAVIRGYELVIAHAGDSRAYLIRGDLLHSLTADHTWVAERVREGVLTPTEAARHDMRHIVTRYLGSHLGVDVEVSRHTWTSGDRLLLCTDGVWEPLSEMDLTRVAQRSRIQTIAATLVRRAVAAGSQDDATALIVVERGTDLNTGDRLAQVLKPMIAAPHFPLALFCVTIAVLLGAAFYGLSRSSPGLRGTSLPTRTPEQVVAGAAATPAATALPAATPSVTAAPVAAEMGVESTQTPWPEPTATPPDDPDVLCIAPAAGTKRDVSAWLTRSVDDGWSCSSNADKSIRYNDKVDLPSDASVKTLGGGCEGLPMVRISWESEFYYILATRVGLRDDRGECPAIGDSDDYDDLEDYLSKRSQEQ